MTQSESIRILYIEDDPGLARLVQKRLGTVGYTIDIASDGEEGLAKYQAGSYDLLFVDQSLPVHDGLEVIRILGSNGSLPPTVMITGTGDERVAVEAMKLGAGDYIVKDVEGGYLELLPTVVKKMLQQRRTVEEKHQLDKAYRAVVEHSLQGLQIIQEGRKVFVNSAYAEMVGCTEEELLALSSEQTLDIVHPDDRGLVEKHYRNHIAGKPAPQRYEFRIIRKDGSVRWVEAFASRIEFHGKPASQVAMIDITERKQAEDSLRESEEKYRSFVERASDGIALIQDGIMKYVNPRLAEMWGGSAQELSDTPFTEHIDPDKIPTVLDRYNRRMQGENVQQIYETVLRRKDGSKAYVELNAGTITYQGKLTDLAFVRDITERKQAEEKLRASEERFRTIFETARDFIFIKDRDSKFTAINPAFERLYGVPASKLIGKTLAPFVKKGMWARIKDDDFRVLNGDIIDDEHPSPITGSSKIHHMIKVPMRDSSGEVIGICGIGRDITGRKQVELELRESEERFRMLSNNAPFAISVMAPDKTLEYFNPRFTELFGYTKEDIPDKDTWFAKAYPDAAYRKKVRSVWEKDRNKKVKIGSENPRNFTVRCKNGQDKIIAFRTVDLQYGRQYLVYDDITDRKKSELALRESEERYRSLIDNIHLGINLIDADFNILMVNAAQIEHFNKPARETIGKKCFREFEKRDAVCPHCPGATAIATGQRAEVETEGVRDDGSHFQVRLQTFPVFAPDGTVTSFIEVVEDITARKEVKQSLLEHKEALQNSFFGTAEALSKVIEDRDPYTSGHSAGVAGLAEAIARVMGLPEDQITGVYIAGVLHDIGKMAVPVEILVKPGRLTDMEMSLIQRHPEAGYEILKGIEFPWPVAQAALQHHERMDGSGYPQGLKGNEIALEARILGVADVVDAMTHHRPYRPAFSVQDAMGEISKGRGRLYDPKVVDACIKVLEGEEAFTNSVYSMSSTLPHLRRGSTKSSILPTTTVMRFSGRR